MVSGNAGCNGGWISWVYKYIRDNAGVDEESAYPYEALVSSKGFCFTIVVGNKHTINKRTTIKPLNMSLFSTDIQPMTTVNDCHRTGISNRLFKVSSMYVNHDLNSVVKGLLRRPESQKTAFNLIVISLETRKSQEDSGLSSVRH